MIYADAPEALSVAQAAQLLGFGINSIYTLIREGRLTAYQIRIGGKWLIPKAAIGRLLSLDTDTTRDPMPPQTTLNGVKPRYSSMAETSDERKPLDLYSALGVSRVSSTQAESEWALEIAIGIGLSHDQAEAAIRSYSAIEVIRQGIAMRFRRVGNQAGYFRKALAVGFAIGDKAERAYAMERRRREKAGDIK